MRIKLIGWLSLVVATLIGCGTGQNNGDNHPSKTDRAEILKNNGTPAQKLVWDEKNWDDSSWAE